MFEPDLSELHCEQELGVYFPLKSTKENLKETFIKWLMAICAQKCVRSLNDLARARSPTVDNYFN